MMVPLALDVPLPPLSSTTVVAYRHETAHRPDRPWRQLDVSIGYVAGASLTTRTAVSTKREASLGEFRPRTELGRKLLALRQAYVAGGGELLSAAALDEELRQRRGGVGDA